MSLARELIPHNYNKKKLASQEHNNRKKDKKPSHNSSSGFSELATMNQGKLRKYDL